MIVNVCKSYKLSKAWVINMYIVLQVEDDEVEWFVEEYKDTFNITHIQKEN